MGCYYKNPGNLKFSVKSMTNKRFDIVLDKYDNDNKIY